MEIRHLQKSDDYLAISRIYEESWKFAYKDIVPQSYLDEIPTGMWAPKLNQDGIYSLVLIEDGIMIGTSSYSKSRISEYEGYGEIISIYLLPEYIGRGYGKRLLHAVLKELAKLGYRDIYLWVLEENHRARIFYEREGLTFDGNQMNHVIGGKELTELRYSYRVSDFFYKEFVSVTDYNALREAVKWGKLAVEQAQQGLKGSAYVVGCYDGSQIAGCARIIWDGGYIAYLADVMVMPKYQGMGIGRHMVELAIKFVKAQLKEGWKIKIVLVAAKGKEIFYKKFGFHERPNEKDGAGMDLWVQEMESL